MKNIVFVDQREAGGKVQDARIILVTYLNTIKITSILSL